MDETKTRPGFPGDRAQIAAEKLRALRERANQALDEHRQRLAQIESELSLRVRQLAEEFETAATHRTSPEGHDAEVAALREQLESDRAKHDKFVEQLAIARRQLDAIQAQPCAACHEAAHQIADSQSEIARLTAELRAAQQQCDEDRARHDKFTEQVAAARQAINDLQSKSQEQTVRLQTEVDAARQAQVAAEQQAAAARAAQTSAEQDAKAARAAQAAAEEEVATAQAARLAAEEDAVAAARDVELVTAECEELQTRMEQLERELAGSLEQLRGAADAEADALRQQLAEATAQRQAADDALKSAEDRGDSLDAELASAVDQRDALNGQLTEARAEVAALQTKIASLEERLAGDLQATADQLSAATGLQSTLEQKVAAAEADAAKLTASLAQATSETDRLQDALNAAQREIDSLRQDSKQLAKVTAELEQVTAQSSEQHATRDELKSLLEQAQRDLAQLRETSVPRTDLADLQQKFDLALEDVQKLKREGSELRQELASRPEASDQQTPELVSLRAECETLAARVKELERAAASSSGPSQELEDLQRRFEMAVDDVRELKQENAKLREQVAKASSAGGAAVKPQVGGNDWAAQRARLMAMLEEEEGDGPVDSDRRKERASIQETIDRTDKIMAEKERELAELRAMQEAYTTGASCTLDLQREEILSADEVVVAERKRVAELQSELEDKLRKAELEFSVERAKLAREQSAVKERLFELEKKLEAQGASVAAEGGDNKPKRRWLSALGLGDEEDQSAK